MEQAFEEAARLVSAYAHSLERPCVLDAGCGLKGRVDFGSNAWLVGLDLDEAALAKNTTVNEKILGDVQTYELQPDSFDIVICWDLLEHLPRPQQALRNLLGALRPGGVLFLVMPNPKSVKALITKLTPHRFHVWVYRHVLGLKNAGMPGYAPFPVFLRHEIAPDAVREFAKRHELVVEMLHVYEGGQMRRLARRRPVLFRLFAAFASLVSVLTLGRYSARLTDTCVVLRRPPAKRSPQDGVKEAAVA